MEQPSAACLVWKNNSSPNQSVAFTTECFDSACYRFTDIGSPGIQSANSIPCPSVLTLLILSGLELRLRIFSQLTTDLPCHWDYCQITLDLKVQLEMVDA